MKDLLENIIGKVKKTDRKTLLIIGVVAIIVIAIVIIIVNNNGKITNLDYDKEKDIYELGGGKVVIEDDFEISYNVVTKEYKINGTITNNTNKTYKNLELTFEFYNQQKEVVGKTTKTVKELKAKDKTNMQFDLDVSSVIYDYKIVDVNLK